MPHYQEVPPLDKPRTILVIVAHHDDIEFGIAGSVARWIDEGAQVAYCIITDGSAGSNEPGTVRADLAKTRRIEQTAAAQMIGVDADDVHFLGYEDGTLEATMKLRKDLTRIIRKYKPYRVVCQDPTTVFRGDGYINHPDHRAAGEAAVYATFPSSESRPIFAELLDEERSDVDDDGYEPHKVSELFLSLTNEPTHYVDISDYIDAKMGALKAHESQVGTAEEAEQGAAKYIRERNAESGQAVGVEYAEMYRAMTLVRANEIDENALQAAADSEVVTEGETAGSGTTSDTGGKDEAKMNVRRDDSIDTEELQSELEDVDEDDIDTSGGTMT